MGHRVSNAAARVLVGVVFLSTQLPVTVVAVEPVAELSPPAVSVDPSTGPADPSIEPPLVVDTSTATATQLTLLPRAESVVRGYSVTFDVRISPAPGGGTIELLVDGATVSTTGLTEGQAMAALSWTPETLGAYSVTAAFGGTPEFDASTTEPFPFDVVLPTPTLSFNGSAIFVARNVDVTFDLTVSPNPGPGLVELRVNDEVVHTGPLSDSGTYTHSIAFDTVGYRQVVARFLGNENWQPRSSTELSLYVQPDPVVLSVTVPSDPMAQGSATATATVTPDPGGGTIRWREQYGWPWIEVPVGPGGVTIFDLSSLGIGFHRLEFEFSGYGELAGATADAEFEIHAAMTLSISANRTSAVVGELPVVLAATLGGADDPSTTVSFWDTIGRVTRKIGTATVDPYTHTATLSVGTFGVGVHSIRATYAGSVWRMPARSERLTVNVAADTAVHATFAPSLGTFYPYRDSVRDLVALGGVLDETATVTIRIYNGSGSLKRSWSLGTKAAGSYSVNWDGRTSGGAEMPAGKYKARATFKDAAGNTRTIDVYTTISWRKATWKSASVTRYADTGTYYGTGGLYYSPVYPHGRIMDSAAGGWIGGQFIFTVKSGAIEYRKLYIEFRGHGFIDRDHPGTAAVIDPRTGDIGTQHPLYPYDQPGVTMGLPFGRAYISSTGKVEAWAFMEPQWNDAYDLNYLKFTYQYAVWL